MQTFVYLPPESKFETDGQTDDKRHSQSAQHHTLDRVESVGGQHPRERGHATIGGAEGVRTRLRTQHSGLVAAARRVGHGRDDCAAHQQAVLQQRHQRRRSHPEPCGLQSAHLPVARAARRRKARPADADTQPGGRHHHVALARIRKRQPHRRNHARQRQAGPVRPRVQRPEPK